MAGERHCLGCKFFRLLDETGGQCRLRCSSATADRPHVPLEHHCGEWCDAGQQYHIRLGWLRALQREHSGSL